MSAAATGGFRIDERGAPTLVGRMAGATLVFVGVGILVSAAVDVGAGGDDGPALALSALLVAGAGGMLWRVTRVPDRLTVTSTFGAVAGAWSAAAFGGAVPYVMLDVFPVWDDALFESVSGFTGTGSTVLAPIETQGRGVLFWRSLTQWYGGMGMVVLAVAVLPFLGVGGMDLLRTEAPGPTSDRLAPRVRETAKRLWLVYVVFTALAVLSLLIAGMALFDAFAHAFTVVSTGGLSPYDGSIGHFDSVTIELVVVGLMLVGGANFTLHWLAVQGRFGGYRASPMFRYYATVFVSAVGLLWVLLVLDDFEGLAALRAAVFNVATLLTSTGYGTDDYVQWVPAAQLLLLGLMLAGGMAGSTAGGIKLIRVRVALKHAARELRRASQPRAVLPVKLGGQAVSDDVTGRVVGFVLLYMLVAIGGTVVVAAFGADLATAGGAVISAMSNMGPALGEAGPASNYLVFTRPARGVIMVLMLAGRLELFPVLLALGALTQRMSPRRLLRTAAAR